MSANAMIPTRVDFRLTGHNQAAIVFVHGFGGHAAKTWASFPDFLKAEPRLVGWDLFGLGYLSQTLRVDVPGLWAADPGLTKLATWLCSALSLDPFNRYRSLALVAHSMGGLVVQRALVDGLRRVGHVFLFGTPSSGLRKALFWQWKRQARDMTKGSKFLTELQAAWPAVYRDGDAFFLRVVAGDRDEFVPPSSSLEPFPTSVQAVVPGNHIEIVKPRSAQAESVQLLIEGLLGLWPVRDAIDSARLAVELGRYREAVDLLMPRADELDPVTLVQLALALDAVGRGAEALQVLERRLHGGTTCTDALGVLGGRLKRRWLVEGRQADLERARMMYSEGLAQAEAAGDHGQAFYHAINIAFLDLMLVAPGSAVPEGIRKLAQRTLDHCAKSPLSHWRLATEGEALAVLGEETQAIQRYREAVANSSYERDKDAMYSQAIRIFEKLYGKRGISRLRKAFGIGNPEIHGRALLC